jgi:hypothetical protein
MLGWTCVAACFWNWILLQMIITISQLAGRTITVAPADISQMIPVITTLLGLGVLRTYEKTKQVAAP